MSTDQSSPAILERFTICGVHGYKDITIECKSNSTIIVAENGMGKTTALNALDAFLGCKFYKLAAMSFDSIQFQFRGQGPSSIDKKAFGSPREYLSERLQDVANTASTGEAELADFLQRVYRPSDFEKLKSDPIIRAYYLNSPHDYDDCKLLFDELHKELTDGFPDSLRELAEKIQAGLSGINILYLPTYRRIEKSLVQSAKNRGAQGFVPGRRVERSQFSYEGVAFGLGDVEARLKEISEEIERASNIGYRSLSAKMLSDILRNTIDSTLKEGVELPDIKSLSLFLGRVGNVENNLAALFSDIDSIYESKQIFDDHHKVLRYFLFQLNSVIERTKSMEQRVEQFASICNSYLTMTSDEKRLEFDPKTLKVIVKNSWDSNPVPLDALSSGEKQVVSLMAKLYLDAGNKFVLIDEPELSLSLEWQKKILPDVIGSGNVSQLIAITHSPFIFDNELGECATDLVVSKSEAKKK